MRVRRVEDPIGPRTKGWGTEARPPDGMESAGSNAWRWSCPLEPERPSLAGPPVPGRRHNTWRPEVAPTGLLPAPANVPGLGKKQVVFQSFHRGGATVHPFLLAPQGRLMRLSLWLLLVPQTRDLAPAWDLRMTQCVG